MMAVYTCIACRVIFADGLTQREHYKTDWHRYNLKRKVADLPPVSAENFRLRVINAQQQQVTADEKQSLTCSLCGKTFSSQNAQSDHLRSRKHKENEAREEKKNDKKKNETNTDSLSESEPGCQGNGTSAQKIVDSNTQKDLTQKGATGGPINVEMEDAETDSDVESVDSFGDEEGLGLEECFFCSFISPSLEENIQHMTVKHSFFLPDAEYLSDLEGLVTYLGQKVGLGNICLWCNGKGKGFHSTQAVQKHMVDKGHCKMLHEGDVLLEYADFYDYRSSYPDYEEGGADNGEEEMETDVTPDALAADGYELVLPSGATVGHRSLQRYYKQNINPRSVERGRSVLPKMLAQYKALGWSGATGPIAERRCKDIAAIQRMKTRSWMRIGTKANKFQPHFRPQVIF